MRQPLVDETDVCHLGANLKDLGKKWFTFSKMDINGFLVIENIKKTI